MRAAAILLALALGGCGLFRSRPIPPEENTPDHIACRAEATRAPAVQALAAQSNPEQLDNQLRISEERRLREVRAYRDCLRRRGLALPGGVEAPRGR